MNRLSIALFAFSMLFVQSAFAEYLPLGIWGGENAAVTASVSESQLSLQFPCSWGQFARPFVNDDGSFEVSGVTGTSIVMRNPVRNPAVIRGQLSPDRRHMSVRLIERNRPAQDYVFTFGKRTFFAQCR